LLKSITCAILNLSIISRSCSSIIFVRISTFKLEEKKDYSNTIRCLTLGYKLGTIIVNNGQDTRVFGDDEMCAYVYMCETFFLKSSFVKDQCFGYLYLKKISLSILSLSIYNYHSKKLHEFYQPSDIYTSYIQKYLTQMQL